MSEQTIKKLLLFWWSYYSKVTYTPLEKDTFECFVKADTEKMLQMAITAHTFGFENAHIVQDMREIPFCFRFQLRDHPKKEPKNPDYDKIKNAFLNEMAKQYVCAFVKNEMKKRKITKPSTKEMEELVITAQLALGIPIYVSEEPTEDIDHNLHTLLLWWWKNYNQIEMSPQEDEMFHTFVEQDVNKALHLAIQESLFEMNPKAVLTIIRQDMLDEIVNELPKIDKNDPDYQLLCNAFLEKLTNDYYEVSQELEITPDIDWNAFTQQLVHDINTVKKERKNKYGN